MQKKLFRFDKYMCVGETFNMDSCSKFWGNLEGLWGNRPRSSENAFSTNEYMNEYNDA